jgi:hypothetical protein
MEEERLISHIPQNQSVIVFLYKCYESADTKYKKAAYQRAINEIYSYWHVIESYDWGSVGASSIKRKINEFLEGFPEEDILYS